MFAAAILAIIIIIAVVIAFLPQDKTAPQWFALAQRQQEIIRVCSLGSRAKYQPTRNFAITCQTGITTSQRQLLTYMSASKMDYVAKQLGLSANAKTDARLKTADSSSTFDDVFLEITTQQLESYSRSLTAQSGITTGVNGREVLTKNQRDVELLLKMVQDASGKTEAPAI